MAMADLIDRNALKAALDDGWTPDIMVSEMWEIVDRIPTVDAEPVRHGRYIGTEYDGYADGNPVYYEWICSECECVFEDEKPHYRYCPNCGAKMDGG